MAHRILIVGHGSVGQRHGANLADLGCRIACADPRADRRGENVEAGFETLDAALENGGFDGAVIATPTSFHVEQTQKLLRAGIPTLLEKPVSIGLQEAKALHFTLDDTKTPLLLGYTWRWWPPLMEVRDRLEDGAIGRIVRVDFWMSAHLEDWHPGEPLGDFFMSSKALGGGALLDESHWIDLMNWFFGPPTHVYGRVEKLSDLDIDSDDHVDIAARYEDGKRVAVHLDLIGRPHEKTIRFVGTGGTLVWSADPNEYRIATGPEQSWDIRSFTCERNDMFRDVAREFVDVIAGAAPSCTLQDGLDAMRIIEAVRLSGAEAREVEIGEV